MSETIKCSICKGDGWNQESAHSHEYGHHDESGECTGYCPIPIQVQCQSCKGSGYIEVEIDFTPN